MQRFPTAPAYQYDFSNLIHPIGQNLTPPLTIKKIEWENRSGEKVLKVTFSENINYGNAVLNSMYFLRFAEDANGQHSSDAEAFFYFISKLNQLVQIPISCTKLDEQGFVYWVLSNEVVEDINNEKNKWNELDYNDFTYYSQEIRPSVNQRIRREVSAQAYLSKNYPRFRREYTREELNLRNLNLEGDLDLEEFSNLKKIYLSGNPSLGEIKNKNYWTKVVYKNPQEWLNHNYFDKNKVEVINLINLKESKTEFEQSGELVIDNFSNLKKINGQSDYNTIKIGISNCPKLEKVNINKFKNNQQLILHNLPNLKEFNCKENKLTTLDLIAFPNLQKIDCQNNQQLIKLNLTNCVDLQEIYCYNNQLTEIKLPLGEKLEILDLSNNNFLKQDLFFLSRLVNLKELNLGNTDREKIEKNVYNRFTGSLEYLTNMIKLEKLHISNTDINSGLEYLPNSIEYFFYCSANLRKDAGVKAIINLLASGEKKVEIDENGRIRNFSLLRVLEDPSAPEQVEINFLEARVQELIELIKKQRGKIADAYLHFCKEEKLLNSKELLKELIIVHLEIIQIRKQNVSVDSYEKQLKQYNEIRLELFNKLNDWKLIEEVEKILKDCEGLVDLEAELKSKLENKALLIEGRKQNLQITDGKEKNLALLYGKKKFNSSKKKHEEQIKQYQGLNNHLLEFSKIEERVESSNRPDLKHLLGKGGYGEVYYGKWKLQDVAVKKLYLSPHNTSESDLKDIRKEIDILKNLRNCYIIQYYDTHSDDQETLIIMEYAKNGTLTKFINDNKDKEHDWNFNTNLIKQITSGLAYIHHENIIHRDLKSMNILLTDSYKAKISDFGLSRTKNISSSQSRHSNAGTLRWMAPEIVKREQKYSEQSDIYALGMVMWEIVAKCTVPFRNFDNTQVMIEISNNGKEVIPDNTPKNIRNIIKGCWKDDPNERIILADILELIENDGENSQLIHIDYALELSNLSKSQSSEETSSWFGGSKETELDINQFCSNNNKIINKKPTELTKDFKRQLSLESQKKTSQGEPKQFKFAEILEYQAEPMSIDCQQNQNWANINPNFTPELIQSWKNLNFTYEQTWEWINIGLQPTDYSFCAWLRDIKQVNVEWVLNHGNLEVLNQDFFQWWQQNQQAQIIQTNPYLPNQGGNH